jgi:hypothetical protein
LRKRWERSEYRWHERPQIDDIVADGSKRDDAEWLGRNPLLELDSFVHGYEGCESLARNEGQQRAVLCAGPSHPLYRRNVVRSQIPPKTGR